MKNNIMNKYLLKIILQTKQNELVSTQEYIRNYKRYTKNYRKN